MRLETLVVTTRSTSSSVYQLFQINTLVIPENIKAPFRWIWGVFVVYLSYREIIRLVSSRRVCTAPRGISRNWIIVEHSLECAASDTRIPYYRVTKRVWNCAVFWQFGCFVAHTNRWQQLQKQTGAFVGDVRRNSVAVPQKQRRGHLQWSSVFKILWRFCVHNIPLSALFSVSSYDTHILRELVCW